MKEDLFAAVNEFFDSGKLPEMINTTTITLIPKVPALIKVKDYRCIACCTSLYKAISKVITRTMKLVLDGIIGHSQFAFIERRCIIDHIICSHELFKGYSMKGISPRCILKVDLRKAYDTLEWSCLIRMLIDLGFSFKFVPWILTCVTIVSYSLVLNGGLTPPFKGKRGNKLGDPMSSYLLVIAMVYLGRELDQLQRNGEFNFHARCKKLNITHICIVDDLHMYCRADL